MVLEQTAAGEGGTATGGAQTADQSGATTVTQIKALNDRLQQLFDWVAAFTGQKPPEAPPPTTSPADGSS
jgi:hypothetical protein